MCSEALGKRGYTTYAGYQVQQNFQVPRVYPGLVAVPAEVFPPPPKKFADVDLTGGEVRVCWSKVKAKREFADRGKRWDQFQAQDLAKLLPFRPDEPKLSHWLAGIGCSGARPMVSAQVPYNQAKALLGRVFRLPAQREWGRGPQPGIWEFAWRFVDVLLPDFRADKMSIPDWLKTMPPNRRRPLEAAYLRYQRCGWQKRYEQFSSFVKTEFLPGFSKDDVGLVRLTEMIDRLIQGPADETHIIAGPFLKPLVAFLKKVWSVDNAIFYGSAGPEALHQFLNERLVDGAHTFFWCDFSMFDNTHSTQSWEFMEKLYRRAGIADADFWRVMDAWRSPKGKIGPLKYRARVMNASGRDDTALANAVLNGVASFLSLAAAWFDVDIFALEEHHILRMRTIVSLSVCGDDSVGALPPISKQRQERFAEVMRENISRFGFEAKFFMSDKLSDAVYLGMRPYPVGGKWFWGKTIGRATYKMGWVMAQGGRDVMAHITGVADMHLLCSRHVPILSDLAAKIVELRQGAKRTPVRKDPNKPWEWTLQGSLPYDESTLKAVAATYTVGGVYVSPGDVLSLIAAIQSVERLPCVLDHWLWRHMIHVDDL